MASLPPASQIPVRIGEVVLGKYVVERVIGSGSMGSLVAVRHQQLGELYAMKFLLPHLMLAEGGVARFMQEASTAARLRSEHAVKVHDVGQLPNGAVYMLMEYVHGSDLQSWLTKRGPLPPSDAALYLMQACDAIGEAHALGIVHRDLKPANLLLTSRANETSCVKVLDFGISKSQRPDGYASSMTRTSAVMGSPHYMSPEQIRSAKYVGSSADIWSLGVVLHELLSGTTPFSGATLGGLCGAILTEPPAPLPAHVPLPYHAIVSRCLDKRPEQRFASVAEFARALDDASRAPGPRKPAATLLDRKSAIPSLVIESRPSGISPKLAKTQLDAVSPVAPLPTKRSKLPWALAALACLLAAAALAAFLLGAFAKPSAVEHEQSSSEAARATASASAPQLPVSGPTTVASTREPVLPPNTDVPKRHSGGPPSTPRTPTTRSGHGID